MEIVHYKKEDSKAVAQLFREIFEENGWTERESDFMDEPDKLFHLGGDGILLVVKEDGKLIGTAGIKLLSPSEGLMKRFYIKKEYRGTGVAKKLLHELIKRTSMMGAHKIVLDVSKKLKRAIRFYEKSGFIKMKTSPREDWAETLDPQEFSYYHKII